MITNEGSSIRLVSFAASLKSLRRSRVPKQLEHYQSFGVIVLQPTSQVNSQLLPGGAVVLANLEMLLGR